MNKERSNLEPFPPINHVTRRNSASRIPLGKPTSHLSKEALMAKRSSFVQQRRRQRRVLMFRYFTVWFLSSLAFLHLYSNFRIVWSWIVTQASTESCMVNGTTVWLPTSPSVVVIGTQKAGTTALASLFHRHPRMVGTSRELHFFDFHYRDLYRRSEYLTPKEQRCWLKHTYLQRSGFPFSDKVAFEKSPSYMISPHIPEAVHNLLPHSYVIALLRNPVHRLVSHFRMQVQVGRLPNATLESVLNQELDLLYPDRTLLTNIHDDEEWRFDIPPSPSLSSAEYADFYHWDDLARTPSTFRSFDRLLQRGMYAVQLERWLHGFGTRLVVLPYELFESHPRLVFEYILKVTETPHWNAPDKLLHRRYQPAVLKHSIPVEITVEDDVVSFLQRFYRPYNDRLADLLGEEWRGIWDDQITSSNWKESWIQKLLD